MCCTNKDKTAYVIDATGECKDKDMNIKAGAPPCPCPGGVGQCITLVNPLKYKPGPNYIFELFGGIIKWVMGIMGSLTLLMFVWGGFLWVTSGGNPEKVKKGSDTMLWAAIGVFLVLASYIILSTFLGFLTGSK